jgi:hypothetical protein
VTATISPTAADRRQLAQVLLDRSGLELNPRVDRDQVLALLARLRPRVDEEGPAAAAAVERLWRSRGRAPSPALLGRWRGWPPWDVWAFVYVLVEAGWLCNEDRRLTPGPKAAGCP